MTHFEAKSRFLLAVVHVKVNRAICRPLGDSTCLGTQPVLTLLYGSTGTKKMGEDLLFSAIMLWLAAFAGYGCWTIVKIHRSMRASS